MTKQGKPQRQRVQFSLRKLLLWTFVVALGLGSLAAMDPEPPIWVVIPGWFAVVFVLRWAFGSKWALAISTLTGMLLFGWFSYMVYVTARPRPPFGPGVAFLGGFMGLLIGLFPFLMVEGTCRLIDWFDGIGQPHE